MATLSKKSTSRSWIYGLVGVVVVAASCDFSVSNPGPMQDPWLYQETAIPALVGGMHMTLAVAVSQVGFQTSAAAQDLNAPGSGSGSVANMSVSAADGQFNYDEQGNGWNWIVTGRARFTADDGVRRIRVILGDQFASNWHAARALIFAGYANKFAGENWCNTVIDGGPLQAKEVSFERAEARFAEALQIASAIGDEQLTNAARAGRASARLHLRDFAGAAEDAAQVPKDFVFKVDLGPGGITYQENRFYAQNNPDTRARATTVWGTYYVDYYLATKDPRVPWVDGGLMAGSGARAMPAYYQLKYRHQFDPINLASGREMRLIVAEGLLRNGQWPDAMSIVDELRADVGVPPWEATSEAEAWMSLKRERGIELWMETRRLGDLHRWKEEGIADPTDDYRGQDTCIPIAWTETQANPNIEGGGLGTR